MKRISLSWLHILVAIVTFISTFSKGQDFIESWPFWPVSRTPGHPF